MKSRGTGTAIFHTNKPFLDSLTMYLYNLMKGKNKETPHTHTQNWKTKKNSFSRSTNMLSLLMLPFPVLSSSGCLSLITPVCLFPVESGQSYRIFRSCSVNHCQSVRVGFVHETKINDVISKKGTSLWGSYLVHRLSQQKNIIWPSI